ncbi:kinesin motor domain-containing protein [Lineolata rhizophorae]|uniref:Kinesin-like protein KIP2 n=1 Tax=Lineolata rhizophorae TaxID=578093 RepID=A0A6A6NTU4_9PEZI|nr:kinesin motor domain-containing protein [Lineolata rhizophorae]
MATTTLPRPSRPAFGPPNTPLPSLPVPKGRKNSVGGSPPRATGAGGPGLGAAGAGRESRRGSAASSQLPSLSSRAVSSSSTGTTATTASTTNSSTYSVSTLPTANSHAQSGIVKPSAVSQTHSSSAVPTLSTASSNTPGSNGSQSGPTPAKTLRKTVSIPSFPQPPKGIGRVTSHPSSPLSASTTPTDGTADMKQLGAGTTGASAIPARDGSVRKNGISPSEVNGSKLAANPSTSLLALPSPPGSRTSSAQGSYATSATTFEDMDHGETKGPHAKTGADRRQSSSKDGKGNVIVSVRVRPDAASNDAKTEGEWMVDSRKSLISYRGREGGEYNYDNVFGTHDYNARVYDSAAKRLVRRVMEGYHGTVFAYGMTGTGKTFSMQGTATNPGVIPLAITDIFSFIRETPHREFLLRVSYLEIYNERIYDLLSAPTNGTGTGPAPPQEEIKLREDPRRGVYATPLKEEIVQSPTQLLRVIARGDNARRTGSTQWNARSSRSHAVVQIVVESRERVPGSNGSLTDPSSKRTGMVPGGVRVSTLSLIDLAGSEKAAENKERRTEGAHINKSLLTLGTVIARLAGDSKEKAAEGGAGSKDSGGNSNKLAHLPYRDSKLTRLLQPALSGNSLVSILCTIQIGCGGSVAAASSHTGETLNTLKFAARARNNIVSHAKKSEEAMPNGDAGSRALLDRYRMEIQELRKQLEAQNKAKAEKEEEEEREERDKEQEEKALQFERESQMRHEEQMLEIQLARTALKERIEHLNRLILSSKSLGVNSTSSSYSSLSMQRRTSGRASILSMASGHEYSNPLPTPISARSSASHHGSSANGGSPIISTPGTVPINDDEDDSMGENGDGTASSAAQIRALQADLADKNRYISTLEKRLLQARRSSQSRVSMGLAAARGGNSGPGGATGDEGSAEALLREKDAEITDLRARLDDKDRMITALRSAARNRDMADLVTNSHASPTTAAADGSPVTPGSGSTTRAMTPNGHHNHANHGHHGSLGLAAFGRRSSEQHHHPPRDQRRSASERRSAGSSGSKRAKGVDEMTRLLDEMIQDRVGREGGGSGGGSKRESTAAVGTGAAAAAAAAVGPVVEEGKAV